jgi:hypothetical protein
LGELPFPAVAAGEQPVLLVEKLFSRLHSELQIRPLDDGVNQARLLTEAAIDALDHVEVVAGGASHAVVAARVGLDGDRLRGTYRFAKLAGDAALFAVRIAAKRMLAAKALLLEARLL